MACIRHGWCQGAQSVHELYTRAFFTPPGSHQGGLRPSDIAHREWHLKAKSQTHKTSRHGQGMQTEEMKGLYEHPVVFTGQRVALVLENRVWCIG